MARYILLAVEDNKLAGLLVKHLRRWGVVSITTEDPEQPEIEVPVVTRAVYAKPDSFCECKGQGGKSFTRGTKLGWWVHSTCGKPAQAWAEGDIWYQSLGTNLLPISEDAPEWRGFNHKNHPGYNPDNPIQRALAARRQ